MISQVYTDLETAVRAITGLPTLQLENTRNVAKAPWCRFTLLPVETRAATIGDGGQDRQQGLAQLDIFTDADAGVTTAHGYADLVLAAFPRGTILTNGTRVDRAWVEAASREGSLYITPVLIRWHRLTTV